MLMFSPSVRIFVCLRAADMRKSLDGLSAMVREELGEDPLSGHLFIFRNRRGDRMKVLYWNTNGFALWYKRLERGRFSFPEEGAGKIAISESAFQLLVGGLPLDRVWNQPLK